MSTVTKVPLAQQEHLRRAFEERVLPRVEVHARIYFRGVRCPQKKADRIAEAVGLAWKWFRGLAQQGKDGTEFPSALASYAAKAVRSGRRVCGQEKPKDVMSEVAQQRRGFYVGKLPDYATLENNPLAEALIDNTRSEVPEQAAFRIDFPAWLTTHTDRNRRIIEAMAQGHRTGELAGRFGTSASRISQLRRELSRSWECFHQEISARKPSAI